MTDDAPDLRSLVLAELDRRLALCVAATPPPWVALERADGLMQVRGVYDTTPRHFVADATTSRDSAYVAAHDPQVMERMYDALRGLTDQARAEWIIRYVASALGLTPPAAPPVPE